MPLFDYQTGQNNTQNRDAHASAWGIPLFCVGLVVGPDSGRRVTSR